MNVDHMPSKGTGETSWGPAPRNLAGGTPHGKDSLPQRGVALPALECLPCAGSGVPEPD